MAEDLNMYYGETIKNAFRNNEFTTPSPYHTKLLADALCQFALETFGELPECVFNVDTYRMIYIFYIRFPPSSVHDDHVFRVSALHLKGY